MAERLKLALSTPQMRAEIVRRGFTFERVERGSHPGNPTIEIFAPDGYQFTGGTHSLLSSTWVQALEDSKTPIESCPEECDCRE